MAELKYKFNPKVTWHMKTGKDVVAVEMDRASAESLIVQADKAEIKKDRLFVEKGFTQGWFYVKDLKEGKQDA